MPAGRPTKYDPMYCDMVVDHMCDGASLTSFAAEIDVDRSTISEWCSVYPEFSVSVTRAKAKAGAWYEKKYREYLTTGASSAQATLMVFGLKNMAGDDWREKQTVEHTGKDGGAILIDGTMTAKQAAEAYRDELG